MNYWDQYATHFDYLCNLYLSYDNTKDKIHALLWRYPEIKDQLDKIQFNTSVDFCEVLFNDLTMKTSNKCIIRRRNHLFCNQSKMILETSREYDTYTFDHDGRNVISLSEGLAKALNETDIEFDSNFFQMPFDHFFIEIPYGVLYGGESAGMITGIYLHRLHGDFAKDWIKYNKVENDDYYSNVSSFGILMSICGSKQKINYADGSDKIGDYITYGNFAAMLIGNEKTFKECVLAYLEMLKQSGEEHDISYDLLFNMLTFIGKVVYYMNSTNKEEDWILPTEKEELLKEVKKMKHGSKRGKKYKKAQSLTSVVRIVLGKSVVYDGEEFDETDEQGNRHGQLTCRFKVRGHFRTYKDERYSEERRRQMQWIAPHWKGPDGAELIDRRFYTDIKLNDGLEKSNIVLNQKIQHKKVSKPSELLEYKGKDYVYFVKTDDNEYIKIGWSTDVYSRHKGLQTGNHKVLIPVGVMYGDKKKENEVHRMFGKYRHNLEWFRYHKDIEDYIQQNCLKIWNDID